MNIIILNNEIEVAERGADIVSHQLANKSNSVLGLAAGLTPVKMYRTLVNRYRTGELSFADAKTFMLDEYVGVEAGNPQSYSHFMQTRFFNLIDINPSKTHALHCPEDADFHQLTANYDERIQRSGGIDLQILGLGVDGDVGFNEAGSSFASRTRVVKLGDAALKRIPRAHRQNGMAATMGLNTIRDAQHILLMATGSHKAKAVKTALENPMSVDCPASCLQFHNNVTVLLDEAAAQDLELKSIHKSRFMQRLRLLGEDPGTSTVGIKAIYPAAYAA